MSKSKKYEFKETQGNEKMQRYFDDLLRNKDFKRQMAKLRSLRKKYIGSPKLPRREWIAKHGHKEDEFGKAMSYIFNQYLDLKKFSNKTLYKGYWKKVEEISTNFHITPHQISLLMMQLKPEEVKNYDDFVEEIVCAKEERDMCNVFHLDEELVHNLNPGNENLLVNFSNRVFLQAYPIAICINPMASKRDVLDFVEKRWSWIENNFLRTFEDQAFRGRKRKHKQEILDFIWENRRFRNQIIKEKLDKKFPGNGLVYYEITKLLQQEGERRNDY